MNDDRTIDVNVNDSEVNDSSRENKFPNSPQFENSENSSEQLRRSTRNRKAVDRYGAVPYV